MTSVKDVRIETPPTPAALGRGAFAFTDDYSVFDWGKMPDTLPGKGASLCAMGACNFERLEANGVPTHYRGVIEEGAVVRLAETTGPPTEMAIDLTQVPALPFDGESGYDYDAFHAAGGDNYLVPLEIVFRNVVPIGSSLRTRSTPDDYGLAYDEWPADAIALDDPIVEFSTKYEEQDRYLDRSAADRIAGKASLESLETVARRVNRVITDRAEAAGFEHQDGKIECLYVDGDIRVADVAGTFDENRFAYQGQQVSKEVVRQYYKRYHPEWVDAVADAKAAARAEGVADWRSRCSVEPKPLPDHVIRVASDLYTAGANAYLDRALFDSSSIDEAVAAVRRLS